MTDIIDHIYKTGDVNEIKKYNIDYIFISQRERNAYGNELYNFLDDKRFNQVINLTCGGSKFYLFSLCQ